MSFLTILSLDFQLIIHRTRIPIIIDAFSLIEQNPIIGIGIGMFKEYGTQTSAHNLFNIITEMGLFLGLMIIIMIIYPLFIF